MRSLGISIVRLEPGEVDLSMPYSAQWTQQNGFVHAGIITAGPPAGSPPSR
jgi:acyl-coenzyme A thioesterase PaaI-like protein